MVLYGDLHLAPKHLPSALKKACTNFDIKLSLTTIFQNSETLYWKLSRSFLEQDTHVLKLGAKQFCLMNSTPWMKLQSYLDWSDHYFTSDEENDEKDLYQIGTDRFKQLSKALQLEVDVNSLSTVLSAEDEEFALKFDAISCANSEKKIIRRFLIGNKPFYHASNKMLLLPSTSSNALIKVLPKRYTLVFPGLR